MINEMCLTETLLESVKEVFETMIFMSVEKAPDDAPQIEDNAIMGLITFKNGLKGCLTICCSEKCARTIAINMLGMNPQDDIDAAGIKDAFGEVTNMVMGSIKSRIQDNSSNLQVSIPTIISGNQLQNDMAEKANKVITRVSIEVQYTAEITFLYTESSD